MKLPCAIAGMNIAGVKSGSRKGEIIAIICVGVSSLVTIVIMFKKGLLGAPPAPKAQEEQTKE